MKRVVLLVLVAFVVSICAWPAGAAYDPLSSSRTERAKAEAFNGKMELLVRDVGKLADQIAAYNKPAFEVRLTREERQYQEMGEDNYRTSRILYNRVWAKDKTLVLGEARGDKRFYATFLTTIDPEYSFVGGIRVGAGTKILENFFGDSIMNAGNVEGLRMVGLTTLISLV